MDEPPLLRYGPPMTDWRGRVILQTFAEGGTLREAAAAAGISRQAVLQRMKRPAFLAAVQAARAVGADERRYRVWLRHPFRGKRPPTGKGHGGKPAFRYGRR
jgi:hypothetical protein